MSKRWKIEVGSRRFKVERWRMNYLELRMQDGGLCIEERPSSFEDFIMPKQH